MEDLPEGLFRNAIDLNRLSNGTSKKLINSYNRIILKAIEELQRIEGMKSAKRPKVRAARLRALLAQTKESLKTWSEKSVKELAKDLEGIAQIQSDFATQQIAKALSPSARQLLSVKSVEVTPSFATAVVNADPLSVSTNILSRSMVEAVKGPSPSFKLTATQGSQIRMPGGKSIAKTFRGLAERNAELFATNVQDGLLTGETTQQIARRLVGNLDFGDIGPLSVKQLAQSGGELTKMANHQVMTLTRTSINQVSNTASQQVYRANSDLTSKYRYVSTLDSRTSPICRELDGKEFFYGKGPEPAQHFNCRSTTVAVLDYDKIQKKHPNVKPPTTPLGKRAAAGGSVPSNTTYGKWLQKQSASVKAKTLGKEKAKYFDRLAKKYGPDEAIKKFVRDDGSEISLGQLKKRYGKTEGIKTKASKVAKERPKAKQSWQRYSNGSLKEGAEPTSATVWTKDRQKLHDKIVEDILKENNPKPQKKPDFFMTGGGSASGKSIMLKKSPLPKGTVVIDSDEIKKRLPEFVAMQKRGGKAAKAAAGYVHEESSYLSKRLMKESAKRRYHTMLDGTGDNSIKSLQGKIQQMSERGMKVKAKYATADIETALERNYQRFLKTKRLVPATYVRDVHRNVSKVVPDALQAGIFDDFELYDMNKAGQAIRVATFTKETGLNIEDQDLWNRFLGKAWQPDSQFTKWTDVVLDES